MLFESWFLTISADNLEEGYAVGLYRSRKHYSCASGWRDVGSSSLPLWLVNLFVCVLAPASHCFTLLSCSFRNFIGWLLLFCLLIVCTSVASVIPGTCNELAAIWGFCCKLKAKVCDFFTTTRNRVIMTVSNRYSHPKLTPLVESDWMGVSNIGWRHSVYAFSMKTNQIVYFKLSLYIKLELKYWKFLTLQLQNTKRPLLYGFG